MAGKLALAFVAALTVATPTSLAGSPTSRVVVASPRAPEQRIGPYRFGRDGSYAAAVRAFGAPTGSAAGAGATCVVLWRALGLRITFSSGEPHPCVRVRSAGTWAGATLSERGWHTDRGLAIGDAATRLHLVYPHARPAAAPGTWTLGWAPGEVGPTVYLQAVVRGGRVAALVLPPGNLSVAR